MHAHLPGDPGRSGTGDAFAAHPAAGAIAAAGARYTAAGSEAGYDGAPASQSGVRRCLTLAGHDRLLEPGARSMNQVRSLTTVGNLRRRLSRVGRRHGAGHRGAGHDRRADTTAYDIDESCVQL
ncbi:MAG: hypothetical protein IPG61_17540 [bacterium]|nr:hypothetical protein [bacterium]